MTQKASRQVHRKGMVRVDYNELQAMRPVLAALERSGWDIRYKVDDVRQVKEIYMEHPEFDVSDEYVEYGLGVGGILGKVYRLQADGSVRAASGVTTSVSGVTPTNMGELPLLPPDPWADKMSREILDNVELR